MNRRGLRVALALFMALTVVSAGAVGPAAASGDFGTDWAEVAGWAIMMPPFGDFLGWNTESDEVKELETVNDATHLDLYQAVTSQETQFQNTKNTLDSYASDSQTHAFVKAENASISEIEAGGTEASVNSSARTAVYDYYTASQNERMADGWSILASQTVYVAERADNTTGIAQSDVIRAETSNVRTKHSSYDEGDGWIFSRFDYVVSPGPNVSVVAENGSTVTLQTVNVSVRPYVIDGGYEWVGNWYNTTVDPTTGVVQLGDFGTYYDWTSLDGQNSQSITFQAELVGVEAIAPSGSSLSNQTVVALADNKASWDKTGTSATMIADNADKYASALYAADSNGTLDAANYTSPYVLAQEYATDYNSTGYWSYAVAMLSSTGTATPDLNTTGLMTVSYNGNSYYGLVMASSFPNGTLETGVEYDGSNTTAFGERAWLVTDSGQRIVLDSTFTIAEMEDKDGNSINSTTEQKYVYEGVNMTDYRNQQKQILALMEEIQDREPAGAGGATSDGFWPPFGLTNSQAAVGGAAVLGIGALSMSGRRRAF